MTASESAPRSRKSGNFPALALTADRGELATILTDFCRRYSNPKTASDYRRTLTHLFRWTTARHPAELSESDLLAWITHGSPANNTVYQRTTKVCTFFRWCLRAELIDRNLRNISASSTRRSARSRAPTARSKPATPAAG